MQASHGEKSIKLHFRRTLDNLDFETLNEGACFGRLCTPV